MVKYDTKLRFESSTNCKDWLSSHRTNVVCSVTEMYIAISYGLQ